MKLFVGTKALILHEGKVLVVREAAYDEGTNEGKWDVPGGRIKPQEKLLEGLAREIQEECGLVVEPGAVLGVSETFPTIKGEACHIVRIYYLAHAQTTDVQLSGDHDLFEWIDPKHYTNRPFVSDIENMLAKIL